MKNKLLRIVATLLVSLMLIMSMTSCGIIFNDGEFVLFENIISFFESPTGFIGRNAVYMASENYKVNTNMMSYFLNNEYQIFMENYESYLSSNEEEGMLSYNPDIPMEEQKFGAEGFHDFTFLGEFYGTWRDYFIHVTEEKVEDMLRYCEYANANGVILDEDDYMEIDTNIEAYEIYATSMGYDRLDKFLEMYFGKGVGERDVRACMEMHILVNKAEEHIMENIEASITAGEIEAKFEEDILKYTKVDFTVCSFEMDSENYFSHADYIEKLTALKIAVDELQTCESYDAFKAKANSIYREIFEKAPQTDFTEEISLSQIDKNEMTEWLFSDDRKKNDVYIKYDGDAIGDDPAVEYGDATVTVYLVREPSHIDNSRSKNFCFVLFEDYNKAQELVSMLEGREGLTRSDIESAAVSFGEKLLYAENYVKGMFSESAMNIQGVENGGYITNIQGFSPSIKLPIFYKSADDTETSSSISNNGGYTFNGDVAINKEYTYDKGISFNDMEVNIARPVVNLTPFNDWLFDEETKIGTVCPVPYSISTGAGASTYIVAVLEGDGDEVWRIEVKNEILNERYSACTEMLEKEYPCYTENRYYDMLRFSEEEFNFFYALGTYLD